MSDLVIPEDLRDKFSHIVGHECSQGSSCPLDVQRKLIERIARLEAPVTDEEANRFGCYMSGNDSWDDGFRLTPRQASRLIAARAKEPK